MWRPVLTWVSAGVVMWVEIWEITDERTPWRPASIAMVKVVAPKQWATTWIALAPVAARPRAGGARGGGGRGAGRRRGGGGGGGGGARCWSGSRAAGRRARGRRGTRRGWSR